MSVASLNELKHWFKTNGARQAGWRRHYCSSHTSLTSSSLSVCQASAAALDNTVSVTLCY